MSRLLRVQHFWPYLGNQSFSIGQGKLCLNFYAWFEEQTKRPRCWFFKRKFVAANSFHPFGSWLNKLAGLNICCRPSFSSSVVFWPHRRLPRYDCSSRRRRHRRRWTPPSRSTPASRPKSASPSSACCCWTPSSSQNVKTWQFVY